MAATRVSRAGMEFTAVGDLRLQFGDRVPGGGGGGSDQAAAAKVLGDSARELNTPRLLPLFVGISLGVVLGSLPVVVPGLPAAVKLGSGGGPMIVAIVLARIGRTGAGDLVHAAEASGLLREIGIVLFLSAVGLRRGRIFSKLGTPVGLAGWGTGRR